ncbi:MAG: helix-turn-helix transcriptional regulator [Armatimonadetes bacterium]|nr:helix-turn-helix transcriptional regulator [Armatimonadota bacterium]
MEEVVARLRSHLHSAHMDSGKSLSQLAGELRLKSTREVSDYLSGRKDLTVELLLRFAEATGKPIWWFFGEQPEGVTVEGAEAGLQNVARIRLYLDAVESEFRTVVGEGPTPIQPDPTSGGPVVVDFTPYLRRAREILSAEVDEVGDVSEESIEMIAHGLYSAETGRVLLPRSRED